jgi:hypothetical protein
MSFKLKCGSFQLGGGEWASEVGTRTYSTSSALNSFFLSTSSALSSLLSSFVFFGFLGAFAVGVLIRVEGFFLLGAEAFPAVFLTIVVVER